MEKRVAISQSNYIPWKGYFDLINSVDEFILYDDVQFTKRDWRNRNRIKTKDGLQWLTIPVHVKDKHLQKINQTKVNDGNWRKEHWKNIMHNYSRATYFSEYKSIFEELYLNTKSDMLSTVNFSFISTICDILGIKTKFSWSSNYEINGDKTRRLINLCKQVGASVYYTGPKAKEYINENEFERANIKLVYFNYSGYPDYRQLWGEFVHEVSILDLIFNEGPNAPKFMKSFKVFASCSI